MTTIAIANPNTPNRVELWCSIDKRYANGNIDFYVINGAWKGTWYTDDVVKVHASGMTLPGIIVWEGNVPGKIWDYNAAINWIEKKLE